MLKCHKVSGGVENCFPTSTFVSVKLSLKASPPPEIVICCYCFLKQIEMMPQCQFFLLFVFFGCSHVVLEFFLFVIFFFI